LYFVKLNQLLCLSPPVMLLLIVKEFVSIKNAKLRSESLEFLFFLAYLAQLVFTVKETCLRADHIFDFFLHPFHLLMPVLTRSHSRKKWFSICFLFCQLGSQLLVNYIFYFKLFVHVDVLLGNSFSQFGFEFYLALVGLFNLKLKIFFCLQVAQSHVVNTRLLLVHLSFFNVFGSETGLVLFLVVVSDTLEATLVDFPFLQWLINVPVLVQKFNVLCIFFDCLHQPLWTLLL